MTVVNRPAPAARRIIGSAAALALMLGLQACSFPGFPASSEAKANSDETPNPGPVAENELARGLHQPPPWGSFTHSRAGLLDQ